MIINKYDKSQGTDPVVGDRVEFCHTNTQDTDGLTGTVTGWFHFGPYMSCIVNMDNALPNGHTSCIMSVVCLRKI